MHQTQFVINAKACFCCLLLCVFVWPCVGQGSFTSKQWQVSSGLPAEVVQAIAQTPDHYLWIGTTGGLLRFDGSHFELFDHRNTPELTSDDVFSLLTSYDGSLWIGGYGSSLLRFHNGSFHRYGLPDGLTNGCVRALYEDPQHRLWVGTDAGLFERQGDRFRRIDQSDFLRPITALSMVRDRSGALWVGGSSLFRITDRRVQEFHLNSSVRTLHIRSVFETTSGSILAGSTAGLYILNASGKFDLLPRIRGTVRTIYQSSDETIWIGTIGDGLYTLRPGSTTPKRFPDPATNKIILSITEDSERNIWIGTQAGLQRLTRTPVSIVPVDGASTSEFGSLMREADGTTWMCSNHLFRMRNGSFKRYQDPRFGNLTVRTLLRDRDGSLWVGTEGNGLLHLSPSGTVHYNDRSQIASDYIRGLIQAHDGSIWVATDAGISHIIGTQISNYRSIAGHATSVLSMIEDSQGDLWAGTFYGLLHLHNGHEVRDEVTIAMEQRSVWSLHQSPDGTLWIGTSDGLYRRSGTVLHHLTTSDGLPSAFVYQILEGTDNRIWLSDPKGVTIFNRSDWESMEQGKLRTLPLTYFPISEDFEPAELFGSVRSAGLIAPTGEAWFPSSRGAVKIAYSTPAAQSAFLLKITQVLVDGKAVTPNGALRLEGGSSSLAIDYAPILLASQSAVRFRLKLEGFDKDWQEVSMRRTAYYTNLPPGKFKFRVEAYRVGDAGRVEMNSLDIIKVAPFYRRGWFVALCALFVTTIIFTVHKLRLSRIHLRFEAVLEERNRVAREMHDTVIQGCTSISALLEASAAMRADDEQVATELNEMARKQVEKTILEARQAVWNLRHGTPLQDDIEAALTKIAEDATAESAVSVTFLQKGDLFPVNPSVVHELLMVVREAVHNALLHGEPTSVRIEASFQPDTLSILVADDGSGFDPAVPSHSREPHFGVQGMQERMRRIGGQFAIESGVGQGTLVKIATNAAVCHKEVVVGGV